MFYRYLLSMPMIKSYTNHVDCKNMSYPSCQVWDPAAQNWQSNNKVSKLEETFQAKDFSGVGALRPRLAEVWHIWPNDWSFQSRPWLQWCKIFQALSLVFCMLNLSGVWSTAISKRNYWAVCAQYWPSNHERWRVKYDHTEVITTTSHNSGIW